MLHIKYEKVEREVSKLLFVSSVESKKFKKNFELKTFIGFKKIYLIIKTSTFVLNEIKFFSVVQLMLKKYYIYAFHSLLTKMHNCTSLLNK